MEENKIRRNLYRVLRKTGVRKNDIRLNASYTEDLKFDLIDWEIFNYYLVGYFNLSVNDDDVIKFENVSDTIKFLQLSA